MLATELVEHTAPVRGRYLGALAANLLAVAVNCVGSLCSSYRPKGRKKPWM